MIGAHPFTWHILTGEYPPHPGGVADYTEKVATGLRAAGEAVHVWTGSEPAVPEEETRDGVSLHRIAGHWSRLDLERLYGRLDRQPERRRLLIQYSPNSWQRRGINLGFCYFLGRRKRAGDQIVSMIHEPFYPWRPREGPARMVLAAIHRWMLKQVLAASDMAFCSTTAMEPGVRHWSPPRLPIGWLPIPSNAPHISDPDGVAKIRHRLGGEGVFLLGYFGPYGESAAPSLRRAIPSVLRDRPERRLLLLGRNSALLVGELHRKHPELAGRLLIPGELPIEDVSRHLQACDLMIQPYDDGANTRRTTLMAALCNGRPVVSNAGENTEPIWREPLGVVLVSNLENALMDAVSALQSDPLRRAQLAAEAVTGYNRHFSLERGLERLLKVPR